MDITVVDITAVDITVVDITVVDFTVVDITYRAVHVEVCRDVVLIYNYCRHFVPSASFLILII